MKKSILTLGKLISKESQKEIKGGTRPPVCIPGTCYSSSQSNVLSMGNINGTPCGVFFGTKICKGTILNNQCCLN
ncbi:hypothetical protein ACSIGC_03440 [Tenacibaculum sp. ZS6-P6]|uniref:hypothetical protein n=1 Tax=Tenacibaculum sp. ZS6-P6 TaxID=3447503 RepID=UPI003F9A2BF5